MKEWLKKFLVRREMTEALKKRVVEGKVDLNKVEQDEEPALQAEPVEVEKPKPKEYVDMQDLTGVLKSVLEYKFK